ncbi:MAG: hypothetical protein KJ558_10520 [Gammaproteobacteria bacterium]|nr:hypothetical protein [Gammaproteobacteria bacterium]MBU1655241.1 hypothetical protein [Gammaproteobacteria bacterium]MBU1961330.1 hypothetical protein [Gammaproteobacteria bacterium]
MIAGRDLLHITLQMMRDDLPLAGLALARLEAFAPDDRPLLAEALPEVPGQGYRDCVQSARGQLDRLRRLFAACSGDGGLCTVAPHLSLTREQLEEVQSWLARAWSECAPFEVEQQRLRDQSHELGQLDKSLDELSGLDLDLGQLQEEHSHLNLLLGLVPSENLRRLERALALSGHLILKETLEQESSRVLIAGPNQPGMEPGEVLKAAGFQPLVIPKPFRSSPEEIRKELDRRRHGLARQETALRQKMEEWLNRNRERLTEAGAVLEAALPYLDVGGAARCRGPLAAMQGWLPASALPEARRLLDEHLRHPYFLVQRRPRLDEWPLTPAPPTDHPWLRPFALLVRQYGVPRFGEIDPTLLFALSFALMFGMMFGDLGQGACLALFGLWQRRRLGNFTRLFLIAGASSMAFGLLYGSVFGSEELLSPLWMSPLKDPILLLKIALGWGVVFLSLGSLLAIGNRLLAGDLDGALFDTGGAVHLLLYLSLLGGILGMAKDRGFGTAALALALLLLGLLAARLWRHSDAPFGERLLTVFIETFELVSNALTSTLSFLRVAAFSLNHVALSLAVFTLADMLQGPAHWLMLVLGNLFVLVLEGMIVAIQVLRLEYYEGFSRYFQGDGRPFNPLRLGR